MKILFLLDGLVAGGKERRCLELMKGLKLDPNVEFELVLMSKEIHYKQVFDLGINIHYIIRSTKKDISVFSKFYKICKNFKPDIVHCWDSMTAIYAVPACKLLHIQLVNGMVVDAPVKQNILNKHWLRAKLSFPFSSIVIGNSDAGLKAYKAPLKRSLCIYNGLDLNRFRNLKDSSSVLKEIFGDAENENFFIAGMVAAFADRKDYTTVIKSAIYLVSANKNIKFILVGEGETFTEIKNSVPVPLLSNIIFLGKRSDVESIVNIFDVGILLTNSKVHGEGISNSIIEYMALGKPVIASRGGGTDEVIFDQKNGYLIDPENESQLTEKIETLIKNKSLRHSLGDTGLQFIYEKFDLKIMTSNYLKVYNNLLKENKN
jgi:glycosyltransferase involved in cell wall biosynthesis